LADVCFLTAQENPSAKADPTERLMFDAIKNIGSLPGLMAKAQEMKARMQTIQEEAAKRNVSADVGGGMVEATVNGAMQLVRLRIHRDRANTTDVEMLEDLIVAAVSAAQAKAAAMTRAEMEKAAADIGLPPGMLG
jgi:DNA-binding YbaB/EbfC family protein